MGRQEIGLTPIAADALTVLGQQVRIARTRKGWTLHDLARSVGVSYATASGIENGKPTVSVGNVLNAAAIAGVPLFGVDDPSELIAMRRRGEETIALLPQRVSNPGRRSSIDLDF